MSNHKLEDGQFLRITELYAFIAVDPKGHEGIMGFQTIDGKWMPMIGADIAMVDKLTPIADQITKDTGMPYELRYFTSHGDVAPSLYRKEGQG